MEKKKILTPTQILEAQRLKAIYEAKKKELGVTQQSIADALEISQGGVGHYLNGRNALNASVAAVFAKKLGVDVAEFSPSLSKEIAEMSAAASGNTRYAGNYAPGSKYPVISKIQAGAWSEAVEPYTLKEIDLWLESDAHIQGNAFWLQVDGDSMTAPTGLSIPEGTYVLFDTGREAVNGSLVIAKLSDSNEATFKKLVIDGGQHYLKGLNPLWPIVHINGNCRIIGVAIETKLRLI